jgi:hypothetical protein
VHEGALRATGVDRIRNRRPRARHGGTRTAAETGVTATPQIRR